jgi:hypothetical protein
MLTLIDERATGSKRIKKEKTKETNNRRSKARNGKGKGRNSKGKGKGRNSKGKGKALISMNSPALYCPVTNLIAALAL